MNYFEKKKLLSLALAGVLTVSLSSCMEEELGASKSDIDMLDPSVSTDAGDNLFSGVTQKKEVNGEDFKLVINYVTDENTEWRVNYTKHLYMTIKTDGLPKDKEVYIDNIHTDTTIASTKSLYDGILQDTMDDRIHNSLMIGFPISDTVSYYGCNTIEGQNSEFIQGWGYGYNGYNGGEVESKRRQESDFLASGVYANQIDTVIDLIIVDKNTNEKRTVSVFSNLLVRVNNRITVVDGDNYTVYEYDMYGNREEIESGKDESLTLKK